jgi:thiol-disulfide isomerase/thioredoxin
MTPFRHLLAPALLALAACSQAPAPAPAASAPPVAPAPAPAPAAPAAPVAHANACPSPAPYVSRGADATTLDSPTLVVDTWDDGCFDLAAHRGQWVVVTFWATWCNPCLKEIPDLAAFDAARDDVDVVGLAFEEIERADMEAFLKDHPIPYPFAVVDVFHPPADFAVPKGLPNTYLIAPDGRVAKAFYGPTTSAELDKLIHDAAAPAGTPTPKA